MSKVNTETTSTPEAKKVETAPVPLLDCGAASKVTKGSPYLLWWEGGTPPFHTSMY